jgi:IS5 family transposase
MVIQLQLEELFPIVYQIYDVTYRKELEGEQVSNNDKLFSIFERHTDIIVKGSREVQFGHKVNLATGGSNLILDIDTAVGNLSDNGLYQPTIERVVANYSKVLQDIATDGGYASLDNLKFGQKQVL